MKVISAEFVSAFTELNKLPSDRRPEFAFIGRSNVGKSSLINMLVQRKTWHLLLQLRGKPKPSIIFLSIINGIWLICRVMDLQKFHRNKEEFGRKWYMSIS